MPRPDFNAAIITDLRNRVIAHNRAPGATPVKLGGLKAIYAGGFAGANPATNALAKVDTYLASLAKAETFDGSDHPRDGDGKFTDKGGAAPKAATPSVSIALPTTRADHQKLIRENAGYAALQSQPIPETRFGAAGGVLRDAGILAAGLGYTVSLARGKSNGLAARGLRGVAGATGKVAAGVGGYLVHHGYAAAKGAVEQALGRDTPVKAATRIATANNRIRASALAGHTLGRKIGDSAFKLQSGTVRVIANAAAAGAETPKDARTRRRAAIAATSLIPALALRSEVKGSIADPQRIGEDYQSFDYRSIQKAVMSDELGKAQAIMLDVLGKGGDIGDLRKALPHIGGHLYGSAGKIVLAGGAALGGALIGGGLGAGGGHLASGKHKGNPNHDAHGRFTSGAGAHTSTGAVIGAVLGAAGLGAAAYLGMRSHNIRVLEATGQRLARKYGGMLASTTDKTGAGQVRRMVSQRAGAIDRAVKAKVAVHDEMVAAEAAARQYGASAPLHYKQEMEQAINRHIAQGATFQPDFRIKQADGSWTTIGDIKRTSRYSNTRDIDAMTAAQGFVERATLQEFAEAIKDLTPTQQETHNLWFNSRQAHIDSVDTQMAAHHTKIGTAEKRVETTAETWKKAESDALDAKSVAERGGDLEATRAADDAVSAADLVVDKAAAAHARATKALEKLKADGAEVKFPPGIAPAGREVIPPPSEMQQTRALAEVRARLDKGIRATETRAYDAKIASARTRQRKTILEHQHQTLAALAILSQRMGTPKGARAARDAVVAAQRKVDGITTKMTTAKVAHAQATADLERLQSATRRKGGLSTEARADLLSRRDTIRADAKTAADALDSIGGELEAAKAERGTAAQAYQEALITPPAPRRKLLPEELVADLKADIHQAKKSMSDTAAALFDKPTIHKLHAFAKAQYAAGKAHATDLGHTLFFVKDDKGKYRLHWAKAVVNGPLAAGAVIQAGTSAKDFAHYAHDKYLGTEEQKRNAKRPELPFDLNHKVNALTGAHYAALTVAHPTKKGERVVLYGERGDTLEELPKQLVAGGDLSTVDSAFQNGKWQGAAVGNNSGNGQAHTGGLENFNDQGAKDKVKNALEKLRQSNGLIFSDIEGAKTPARISYIADGTNAHGADGAVIEHMRRNFLNQGKGNANDKTSYFAGLKALFSHHAQVLTPTQRYKMLTNKTENGAGAGYDHGLFGNSGEYTSDNGTVGRTLAREVSRAVKLNPSKDDAINLHRAVAMVGLAKGLSSETLAPIQAEIAKTYEHTQGQQQHQQQTQHQGGNRQEAGKRAPTGIPKAWDSDELANLSAAAARQIQHTGGGGLNFVGGQDSIAHIVRHLAAHAHHTHDLDMRTAIQAAKNALQRRTEQTSPRAMADSIESGYAQDDGQLLRQVDEEAAKLKSVNKLDDLDGLMKAAFDGAKHPRIASGQGGGEFTSEGGETASSGGRAARAGAAAARAAQPGSKDGVSEFHPAVAVPDLANLAGMQAAWQAAGKFTHRYVNGSKAGAYVAGKLNALHPTERAMRGMANGMAPEEVRRLLQSATSKKFGPTLARAGLNIAERFLPAAAKVAVGTAGIGGQFVVSGAAGQLAGYAGDAAVDGAYRAAGGKRPKAAEPNNSIGRMSSVIGANFVGDLAGANIGGKIGGAIGARYHMQAAGEAAGKFIGGIGTSWAAGVGSGRIYDWFNPAPARKGMAKAAPMGARGPFDGSKHPRAPAGQHGGGEFQAGGGAAANLASRTAAEGGWHAGEKVAARVARPAAGLLTRGLEAASHIRLPGEAGAAVGLLATGGRLAAGYLGSEAAAYAGNKLIGAKPGPAQSTGRSIATSIGGFAGSIGGAAAGSAAGPLGTAGGSIAGGFAGEKAAGRVYDWFAGYPKQHVQRATRLMSPNGRVTA